MLGGQQIPAYKTLSKRPQHMPRHSAADVRLFRVIAWGATSILAIIIAAATIASIADYEFDADPIAVAVIPVAAVLLLSWWLVDALPRASRWLALTVAIAVCAGCIVMLWSAAFWNQAQFGMLAVYTLSVAVVVWRQLRIEPMADVESDPA